MYFKKSVILIYLSLLILTSSCGAYKKVDQRNLPDTAKAKARKNVDEGRGAGLGGLLKGGGTNYEFSTSNPIWRASLETLGIYDAEGGLSTELGYGIGALGVGQDYANTMTRIGLGTDVSADPHLAYTTPAGLIPFGVSVSVGYAPNTTDGQSNSFKSTGGIQATDNDGTNATQYKVTIAPDMVPGLSVGADYYEVGNTTSALAQEKTAGTAYANYKVGNWKFGVFDAYLENAFGTGKYTAKSADTATASNANRYNYSGIGAEFAVNDALSISYSQEKYERIDKTMAETATTQTETSVESEADYIQVAYNIGGATLGLAMVDTDNSDYTDTKEEKKTLFTIGMEF